MKKSKIKLPLRKNYLAIIENSKGAKIFRDCFGKNRKIKNLTEKGVLSCAFFVSSILYLCGLIPKAHLSVKEAVKDIERFGWFEIARPRKGSVLLWEEKNGHYHLGFYLGRQKAISNNFQKKTIRIHHFTYHGKRKIEKIFWHKKLNSSKTLLTTIQEP